MYKRTALIIFFLLNIIVLFSQNIYVNDDLCIKFKIPNNCRLWKKDIMFENNKYNISIISNYELMGYIKESKLLNDLINDFKNKKATKIPGGSYEFIEYIIIDNITSVIDFGKGGEIQSGMFSKRISFIKNDKLISIDLAYKYAPPKSENDKTSLGYKIGFLDLSKADKQIKNYFKNGKKIENEIPKELIELYKLFDELVTSIEFLDSKPMTYKSSVDNLRFRETPNLKGKFIRSLTKVEKLELIETGKSESINGVKGNWLKVKTEKGEIGWCFDAYLEEVKKN